MIIPWLGLGSVVAVALASGASSNRLPVGQAIDIDHVILALSSLEAGIEEFERATGVKPVRGGEHPGRGTQNALVSLGGERYLEIMAPLPSASRPASIPFTHLTPAGWALRASDLQATLDRLKAAGFAAVGPTPGSRRRPDGSMLEWQTGGATGDGLDLAPFFIQWAAGTAHPSTTSPGGCRLESLELSTPQPNALQRLLDAAGYQAAVRTAPQSMRIALICPKGPVSFELLPR